MRRLAVIPARDGSKRIPGKNIRDFAGKPMISYAIEAAQATGLFDHLVVSTDSAEIGEIARAAGAETPFVRPSELADDHTPTVPVIAHAVRACLELGWQASSVCCIYPAVPLIRSQDIADALDVLERGPASYVFPVTPYSSPIQRALRRGGDGRISSFYPQYREVRTQDLAPAFHDTGQFYWGWAQSWLDELGIHANGASIVLPEWRVVDIDTADDWKRAEFIYRSAAGYRP